MISHECDHRERRSKKAQKKAQKKEGF